jgi:hypothetical protein
MQCVACSVGNTARCAAGTAAQRELWSTAPHLHSHTQYAECAAVVAASNPLASAMKYSDVRSKHYLLQCSGSISTSAVTIETHMWNELSEQRRDNYTLTVV